MKMTMVNSGLKGLRGGGWAIVWWLPWPAAIHQSAYVQRDYLKLKRIILFTVPADTKHLYNICTTSAQRLRRWPNVVQMLYKCFAFAGVAPVSDGVNWCLTSLPVNRGIVVIDGNAISIVNESGTSRWDCCLKNLWNTILIRWYAFIFF